MNLEDTLACQSLCGQDSMQVTHRFSRGVNLTELKHRLGELFEVRGNSSLLRCVVDSYEFTVFSNGRAIVKGTRDPAIARRIYAAYIGA